MSKNKQDDIYKAAMELFAERGYDGTTVPMIAEKANVGAGTIYRYFENKESLVNDLFVKSVVNFSETIKNGFPSNGTVRKQFTHIFYQLFKFAKENPYAITFINTHDDGYYLDENSKKIFNDFLSFIMEAIEEGKNKGIIRNLPSKSLIAMVYGSFVMLFKMFQSDELKETPELLKELEESSWNAIRII
jgi:AcrR family transcriptional regulator